MEGFMNVVRKEITARRSRVAWLEQIKADELKHRNLWRSVLVPLSVWKRKVKKHAMRKANNPAPATDKRWKVDESSLEKSSSGRGNRLVSDSDEGESSRKVVCISDSERAGLREVNEPVNS